MPVYYNEFDQKTAAWLKELIHAGYLPAGDVDERSIWDVKPNDIRSYTQCHFFAGIGGWPLAIKWLCGWPDDRPVWTGSCPCQPFSGAGKRLGFADERHAWPAFYHLIRECRPGAIFGEQVAAATAWFDLIQNDLEGEDYAFGAADLCAAGVAAPHIRQRLYWCAFDLRHPEGWMDDRVRAGLEGHGGHGHDVGQPVKAGSATEAGSNLGMADSGGKRRTGIDAWARTENHGRDVAETVLENAGGRAPDWLERAYREIHAGVTEYRFDGCGDLGEGAFATDPTGGFWRDPDWLFGRDGKFRPVEPGTFPLGDGVPCRVDILRGYGNAVVPQVAAAFIKACTE